MAVDNEGFTERMVEAGGIEPPSAMGPPQPLRAYPVIESRHWSCRQAGHSNDQRSVRSRPSPRVHGPGTSLLSSPRPT